MQTRKTDRPIDFMAFSTERSKLSEAPAFVLDLCDGNDNLRKIFC